MRHEPDVDVFVRSLLFDGARRMQCRLCKQGVLLNQKVVFSEYIKWPQQAKATWLQRRDVPTNCTLKPSNFSKRFHTIGLRLTLLLRECMPSLPHSTCVKAIWRIVKSVSSVALLPVLAPFFVGLELRGPVFAFAKDFSMEKMIVLGLSAQINSVSIVRNATRSVNFAAV